MQTEPTNAFLPKRKRRCFQFSLRTLMIGVTLLAIARGYVASQAQVVRDRRAFLGRPPRICYAAVMPDDEDRATISSLRRWLGDYGMKEFRFLPEESNESIATARRLFLEAKVTRMGDDEQPEPLSATQP
jgi:hypothetical protein